jgi:hypothetical protein
VSTFKHYLVIQLTIFVFGIIGPIFLTIFFASQPDPSVKWAFWFGLFITYADIMIALAVTKGTLDNEKASSDARALAVAKRLPGEKSTPR